MAKVVTKGLIGVEDLSVGTSTFSRATSTGGSQTMTQIDLVTGTNTKTLTNKTLTSPVINTPTITSPTTTGTDSGVETLVNKTIDTAGPNTLKVGGVDVSTALASYSPTIASSAGTLTAASAVGFYKQVGKMVFVDIAGTITTNGTGSGSVQISLPVTPHASHEFILNGRDDGSSGKMLQGKIAQGVSPNSIVIFNYDGTYPAASGSILVMSGWYEAA